MMAKKLDWRAHLLPHEAQMVAEADAAKAAWEPLAAQRARIINRAIQRAKAGRTALETPAAPTEGVGETPHPEGGQT